MSEGCFYTDEEMKEIDDHTEMLVEKIHEKDLYITKLESFIRKNSF